MTNIIREEAAAYLLFKKNDFCRFVSYKTVEEQFFFKRSVFLFPIADNKSE
jgi:hypothetical protein